MHDDPTRDDRRDVLTLAMGALGTVAQLRDAGIGAGGVAELRAAREFIVEKTTPPAGVPQRPGVAAATAEVLGIIDTALRGEHPATGSSALDWAEGAVQQRLAAILLA